MGYTHYFGYVPDHPQFIEKWTDLVDDAQVIIAHCRGLGIEVGPGVEGYEDKTEPEANERWIWLNGIGEDGHETLLINGPGREAADALSDLKTWYGDVDYIWAFCKTARKPYDLIVTTILLRATQLMPEAFAISSDGSWDEEWLHGPGWWGAGEKSELSPRNLVASLFNAPEFGNPLDGESVPTGATKRRADL